MTLILRLAKTIFRRRQKLVGQIDWLILDSRCGHKWEEGEQVAVALVQIPGLDLVPLFGFAAVPRNRRLHTPCGKPRQGSSGADHVSTLDVLLLNKGWASMDKNIDLNNDYTSMQHIEH